MRRIILERLSTHLKEYYSINTNELLNGDETTLEQVDSILAFKSDSHLDELRAALERLEEDSFGICLSCKEEIDRGLMDADPARRLCEKCERVFSHVALKYQDSAFSA